MELLIKKLDHEIEEIRVRALKNILLKLDCQVVSVGELAEEYELFEKLIRWFRFPVCPEKENVLELILKLAKTETGRLKLLKIDPRLKFLRDFDITESERNLSTIVSNILFAVEYPNLKDSHLIKDSKTNGGTNLNSGNPNFNTANFSVKNSTNSNFLSNTNNVENIASVANRNLGTSFYKNRFDAKTASSCNNNGVETHHHATKKNIFDDLNSHKNLEANNSPPPESKDGPESCANSESNSIANENKIEADSCSGKNQETNFFLRRNHCENDIQINKNIGEVRNVPDNAGSNFHRDENDVGENELLGRNKIDLEFFTRKNDIEACLNSYESRKNNHELPDEKNNFDVNNCHNFKNYEKWETLVLSDYHVLSAVDQSLSDPALVEHSCNFFKTILIRDFPAPIFLQYSSIFKSFLWLLKTKSGSTQSIISCLSKLVLSCLHYTTFCEDPAVTSYRPTNLSAPESCAGSDDDVSLSAGLPTNHRFPNQARKIDKEDLCNDRSKQISVNQFCSLIILHLADYVPEIYGAVNLLRSSLKLFLMHLTCSPSELWLSTNPVAIDCCEHLKSFMAEIAVAYKTWFGDSFKQLRIVASICEFFDALIPINIAKCVVPEILQDILPQILLDPTILFMYPKLHIFILQYVQTFQNEILSTYKEMVFINESMVAAGIFLQSGLTMPVPDALKFMSASLPSLPFHCKFEIINMFVYFCSHKILSKKEDIDLCIEITLKLLANSCDEIRCFMYKKCHKLICSKLGLNQVIKTTDPVPLLKFIINSEVIYQIVLFGIFNETDGISEQAKEIITHIISCQKLVSSYSFKDILAQVGPVLPLLECCAGKTSEFSRSILALLNPDTSPLSQQQLVSGNLRLLFRNDPAMREEGIARMMWLMHSSTVVEQASEILLIDKPTHPRQTLIGVYEVGSMYRVIELLTTPFVEDRLRRSALIQLSVMTEDWKLHDAFIEQKGLKLMTDILLAELEEPWTESGRDIILSTICVLKNLVKHNTHIRLDLCSNLDIYKAVFSGLLKYHAELRLKRDCAELLAFLLFAEQILTPTVSCISVVDLVKRSTILPFDCSSHSKQSLHSEPSLVGLLNNENCKNCLSVNWSIVTSNGGNINDLITNNIGLNSETLPIPEKIFCQLQSASLPCSITGLLYAIQNAIDHSTVIQVLNNISRYLEMCWLINTEELNNIPLKSSLERFFVSPPANNQDQELLVVILQFISLHSELLHPHLSWLSNLFADKKSSLSKLVVSNIGGNNSLSLWKEICIEIFYTCKKCVQLFKTENWEVVLNNTEKCLQFSHTQHFYNLAFLDSLLSCFVEITVSTQMKQVMDSTVLWELISAFHCSNPLSFMGLSVTRSTLILLNNLFHYAKKCKGWEDVWLVEDRMLWFPLLWASRDVFVRASSFQLLSGLTYSRRGAEFSLHNIDSLWAVSLSVFLNHQEASLVRENAANVCSNIISHGSKELMVERCRDVGLFRELTIIVTQLKLEDTTDEAYAFPISAESFNESGFHRDYASTTPGLLKAACNLVKNLACLNEKTLSTAYQEGFSISLFRFLKCFHVSDPLPLEVVTMLCAVCSLSAETMHLMADCLVPDCSASLLMLLNCSLYVEDMTVERDLLWSEIWLFLSTISSSSSRLLSLNSAAVSALLYSINSSNRSLQMNALIAVKALSPSFAKDVANELIVPLLALWDRFSQGKKRIVLYSALGQLFMDWSETSLCAEKNNFIKSVLRKLQTIHVNLSVSASEALKSRKNHPCLLELIDLLGLLSNYLAGNDSVKLSAAEDNLSPTLHNLWVWCTINNSLFQRYLEVLCTYTADSPEACSSLITSSIICGKIPRSSTLLHALISFISKESEPSVPFSRAITTFSHACQSKQCRVIISKNQVLTNFTKIANLKKGNEEFMTAWLRFFAVFSSYHEGQTSLIQLPSFFTSLLSLANHVKPAVQLLTMTILMNLSFCSTNKSKILSNDKILDVLSIKLDKVSTLSLIEIRYIVATIWSLAANCQKAKLSMKRLSLHCKLETASDLINDPKLIKIIDDTVTILKSS